MKLKQDFVTNSSSTSFTFVFEGTKPTDLFKILVKHEKSFELEYERWNDTTFKADVWDLIEVILKYIKRDVSDAFYKPDIYSMDHLKDTIERNLQENKKYVADKENGFMTEYYKEDIIKMEGELKVLNKMEKTGKTFSNFELSFGNDGVVCGDFGTLIECETAHIEEDDLFIIKVSQH